MLKVIRIKINSLKYMFYLVISFSALIDSVLGNEYCKNDCIHKVLLLNIHIKNI